MEYFKIVVLFFALWFTLTEVVRTIEVFTVKEGLLGGWPLLVIAALWTIFFSI